MFTLTEAQYKALLARITGLERHVNDLTVAHNHMASLSQLNELSVLYQTQLDVLRERITGLQNTLNLMQNINV